MLREPTVPYRCVQALHETSASEESLMAQLAAHGVRYLGAPTRPAVFRLSLEDTLLSALRFAHDPRLFEALPALVIEGCLRLD